MKLGKKISKIVRVRPEVFAVRLQFVDGPTLDVDLSLFFREPKGLCAEVLRGGMFDRCYVESGALAWPNGLDLCPDAIFKIATKPAKARRAA
ncbi:MAG: DUF2442 domain-containing protein [Deltaproteobacteria bacterium]|nr:DUF2442 domain-containing protein [Deltaproteobacteria bacterium]